MLKWAAISFSRGSSPPRDQTHISCTGWWILDRSALSVCAQSYVTLCNPMDCSPQGSSVFGIFQARILDWVVTSFSRGSSPPRDWTLVTSITGRFFTTWITRESTCSAGDWSLIPGLGRSPGEGNDCPLQYSCLEIPQTEKPGGLQSMGSQELDMTEWLTFVYLFQPPGKPINFPHFA